MIQPKTAYIAQAKHLSSENVNLREGVVKSLEHIKGQGDVTHAKLTSIEEKVDEISDSIHTAFSAIHNESSLAFQSLSQTVISNNSDISAQLNTIHERITTILVAVESSPPSLSDLESVTAHLRSTISEQLASSVLEIGDKQTAEAMTHFNQMNASLQSLMDQMKSNEQTSVR
jgi:predicted  nucleic acid-binding Zn-ribbon protein